MTDITNGFLSVCGILSSIILIVAVGTIVIKLAIHGAEKRRRKRAAITARREDERTRRGIARVVRAVMGGR